MDLDQKSSFDKIQVYPRKSVEVFFEDSLRDLAEKYDTVTNVSRDIDKSLNISIKKN
jgi:hypothetical protein